MLFIANPEKLWDFLLQYYRVWHGLNNMNCYLICHHQNAVELTASFRQKNPAAYRRQDFWTGKEFSSKRTSLPTFIQEIAMISIRELIWDYVLLWFSYLAWSTVFLTASCNIWTRKKKTLKICNSFIEISQLMKIFKQQKIDSDKQNKVASFSQKHINITKSVL